ncbi:MAG: hypothetical protein LAT66_00985 [Alkalimonas sp.]|nr:hypothetical protein [Alkalimonas sp.]
MKNHFLYVAYFAMLFFAVVSTQVTFAHAGDQHQYTSQTKAEIVDDNLFLLGTFDDYTAKYVIAILEQNRHISRIVLTANPGSINDAETLRLGRYIRQRGLDTHLIKGGVATSGGVSLLLAGINRSAGFNAFLGVHSWAQCSRDNRGEHHCIQATAFEEDDKAHDLHRVYIKEMLGDDSFYWFSIHSAAHNSIHWLAGEELIQYRVINTELEQTLDIPFAEAFAREYELTCHNCPKG